MITLDETAKTIPPYLCEILLGGTYNNIQSIFQSISLFRLCTKVAFLERAQIPYACIFNKNMNKT